MKYNSDAIHVKETDYQHKKVNSIDEKLESGVLSPESQNLNGSYGIIRLGPTIMTSFVDNDQDLKTNSPTKITIQSQGEHSRNDVQAIELH